MPWANIKSAKKAGAITKYLKKAVSLTAINKLYDIYDSIKATGKADNPFAVAMDSWKELIKLKNGRIWVLKPQKKTESEEKVADSPFPSGIFDIGDGTLETFRTSMDNAVKGQFGAKNYVYIVATYKSKVVVSVENEKSHKSEYYELPYTYTVSKNIFKFGHPVKVKKMTSYLKAEQENWSKFKKQVSDFVNKSGDLYEVVRSGIELRRRIICRPES